MFSLNVLLLLVTSFVLSGADASGVVRPVSPLVSTEKTSEVSLAELKQIARFADDRIGARLRYGVKSYRIVYKTTYKGKSIDASGVVFVPAGIKGRAPLLSLQHGTTFLKNDVPSVGARQFSGLELFASAGFVVLMPDFIGYGQSSSVFHPYYDKKHSAMTVIDMIKSAKDFLAREGVGLNEQLFLAGYSEGGYVTLAAAEEIETNATHGLTLTAVAAGAGGYDLTQMLRSVSSTTHYAYPAYLAFVLMSYNTTYDWNKPLDYYFTERCADALRKYMDGAHDGWFINQRLSSDVRELFNPSFYSNLRKPGTESYLESALKQNSVQGWKASAPIRLYHGTHDEIIPYDNSEVTLQHFRAAGARDISLKAIRGGTHGSSFGPMMEAFIPWFYELVASE